MNKPKIKETDSVEFVTDTPSLYDLDYKDTSLSNLSCKDNLSKLSDEYVKRKLIIDNGKGYAVKDILIVEDKTYYLLWLESRLVYDNENYVVNKHDAKLCRMVYVEAKDIKFGWENPQLQSDNFAKVEAKGIKLLNSQFDD